MQSAGRRVSQESRKSSSSKKKEKGKRRRARDSETGDEVLFSASTTNNIVTHHSSSIYSASTGVSRAGDTTVAHTHTSVTRRTAPVPVLTSHRLRGAGPNANKRQRLDRARADLSLDHLAGRTSTLQRREPLNPALADASMDDVSNSSSASYANTWISWFLASKGNEYFCEVDEEYIMDRFNLTGLNVEVQGYSAALELITDQADTEDMNDDQRDQLETAARHLYGLIHARYIITSRGLQKMIEKYKKGDFGRCPRVLCYGQQLLPLGLSDLAYQKAVKLYCPRCEDLYSPKSSRHGAIDGAYFGSTFAHMLFMVYPNMIPGKSVPGAGAGASTSASTTTGTGGSSGAHGVGGAGAGSAGAAHQDGIGSNAAAKVDRIRPKIFGFAVHDAAKLQRWQERQRDKQIARLERIEAEQQTQQH